MKTLMFRRAVQLAGFTIVELLITVLMIGILASIGIVAYNAVQARTNDDVRAADVALIMDALEQYYRKNGDYPANDQLNPSGEYPQLTNYSAVKSLLPTLTEDMLTGPGGYRFYATCVNSGTCLNSSADWKTYMTKAYRYSSRYLAQGPGAYAYSNVPASYGDGTGWGCTTRTYYSNPGYVIAWYSESKKIWIFKRSQHGQVEILPYDTGPVAPQTCTFS
jgi:prepilin-type N-terminal cleavage/methylation domain-containing protein